MQDTYNNNNNCYNIYLFNENIQHYHFLNSISQLIKQLVGTIIKCGPHKPRFAARYPSKEIV